VAQENGTYRASRPKGGLANDVDQWRTLADRCGSQLVEMPHIAPAQAALREILGRIVQSFTEQAVLEAQLSAMFQRRRRDVAAARDLRGRLAASLAARYGPSSEELRLYGLKPRRRSRVRKKPEPGRVD
jgi:hypothetical protein